MNRPVDVDGNPILQDRFGKRMFFNNRESEKDVFKQNIAVKSQKAERMKIQNLMAKKRENEYLGNVKTQYNIERCIDDQIKNLSKNELIQFNRMASKERNRQIQKLLDIKKQERYSFFPFNEGEKVEKKREEQKIQMTQELRDRTQQLNETQPLLNSHLRKCDLNNRSQITRSSNRSPSAINSNGLLTPVATRFGKKNSFHPSDTQSINDMMNKSMGRF